MHRRDFIRTTLAALVAPAAATTAEAARAPSQLRGPFADIERRVSVRLGVAVLDTATGRRLGHRADERFPMCSTFKWLLVAQVLSRVDLGEESLGRRIPYGESDLLAYAPVTRQQVGAGGMSVSALCDAAIRYSDNTAANLLLGTVGGPAGLTAYVRRLGDRTTRLDRLEPALNEAVPGDPRDTTTPAAMLAALRHVLLGRVLSDASRQRLVEWLVGNTTGGTKLRAGLPPAWRVADKTGGGEHGATNDVAIVWPAPARPVLIAAYLTETTAPADARDAALADVARQVTAWLTGGRPTSPAGL